MSIRVLENNFKRRERCTHCNSLLEFSYKDIKHVMENVHHLPKVMDSYIICPCCDHTIILKSKYDEDKKESNNKDEEFDNKLYSYCPECGKKKFTKLPIEGAIVRSCLDCGYEIEEKEKKKGWFK